MLGHSESTKYVDMYGLGSAVCTQLTVLTLQQFAQ